MTTRDFTANVISASKVVPDGNFKTSKASGVWDINEALDLIKGGNWPNAANIDPAAFVDALFSCDLWDGNGSTQTITNNIDLSNKGGLVWIKSRDQALVNGLFDTVRGKGSSFAYRLLSDDTNAQSELADGLSAFNSNGFALGSSTAVNGNTYEYVGWTFRKQPKFFDVVTWTGTGSAMTIDHNLGQVPGMIIVKSTSATYDWAVWHREFTGSTDYIKLNTTAAKTDSAGLFGNGSNYLTPTSTQFFVGGNNQVSGEVGGGYVAYLFAHNNDDGGFGEPGDQDIIKCGSYTGNGSSDSSSQDINLGFESQWVLIKNTSNSAGWYIIDNMRGMSLDTSDGYLYADSSSAEGTESNNLGVESHSATSTGFRVSGSGAQNNQSGHNYIYMAIRRGGMQTPTLASDVFNVVNHPNDSSNVIVSPGFTTDFAITSKTDETGNKTVATRLMGNRILKTNSNAVQSDDYSSYMELDHQDGIKWKDLWGNQPAFDLHWKRARGFCDVVAYTGTGSARTVAHNLGVAPEMMWVKCRSDSQDWAVYHNNIDSSAPEDYGIYLNDTASRVNSANFWNDTAPTSSVFTVGTAGKTNGSSKTYIAYLFATAAGVSKLGSYTGNGSSQNIDCGFSGGTGAKFVLIKNVDATGSWVIFDTYRGLVAGNDSYLRLDVTNAEGGGYDFIDPLESGFTINQTGGVVLNESGETYIFYAIA